MNWPPRPDTAVSEFGNKINRSYPGWPGDFSNLRHEYVEHDLMDSLVALNEISLYTMYEVDARDGILRIVLSNLQSQISHLYHILDYSGLSKIISKHESLDFIEDFSFAPAARFRDNEKELFEKVYETIKKYNKNITKLQIPEEIWNKFWETVDRNKGAMVTKMRRMAPSPAFIHNSVYCDLNAALYDGSGNFTLGPMTPLPPYRWSKGLCVSIGGILSISGILSAIILKPEPPPPLGITLASIIAGVIGSSIPTGMV